jgi:hypothetical protein
VKWFEDLWARVSKFIEPIMKGVDAAKNAASSVGDAASNAWSGGVDWFKDTLGFGGEEPAAAITQAPVSGESKASLDGQLTVSFIGAPPGTRVDEMRTNQPGLRVKQEVGMRSLAGAG